MNNQTEKSSPNPTYKAFLVRLWLTSRQSGDRIVVEEVHEGKRFVFHSMDELMRFLKQTADAESAEE